jgi:hypothetical protein
MILILLLALSAGGFSQFYNGGMSGYYSLPQTKFMADSSGNVRFKPGDMGFSMQMGAFAGSYSHGNPFYGTFLSPSFAYNVSDRFRLKAGVTVTQGFGNGFYGGYENLYHSPNTGTTTTAIFVQGDYLLSNKVMLSGAVYKEFSPFNAHVTDPRLKTPENQGMLLNLSYRPFSNFEINASFEYGQGNRSVLNDPFYRHGMFPGFY